MTVGGGGGFVTEFGGRYFEPESLGFGAHDEFLLVAGGEGVRDLGGVGHHYSPWVLVPDDVYTFQKYDPPIVPRSRI